MFSFLFGARRKTMRIDSFAMSETGLVRKDNQDNYFIDPKGCIFAVADGMGGAQGGAQASAMICSELADAASSCKNSFANLMKKSADAISRANRKIREYATEHSFRQMGSTVVALFVSPEKASESVLAHVGDSRAYRLRNNTFELLTHDHTIAGEISRRSSCRSLAEELTMRAGPLSHVLTRAVGIEDSVFPDWRKTEIRKGDILLLCSDGVYDMVHGKTIESILKADCTLEKKGEMLAKSIVEGGAHDNYTFIILKAGDGK